MSYRVPSMGLEDFVPDVREALEEFRQEKI